MLSTLRFLADRIATLGTRRPDIGRRASVGMVPFQGVNDRIPRRDPGMLSLLESYNGWVFKAINVISDRISEIPFKVCLKTPKGSEVDSDPLAWHQLYQLLGRGAGRRPNPLVTSRYFRKLTSIDLELTGNAFWYKARVGGVVKELWRIRPDRMAPVVDNQGMVLGWAFLTPSTGDAAPFKAEDIVHFKYPHPILDPYMGVGPLRAAAYAVDIDTYNKKFQRKFFENGTQVSLVLQTDQSMDREQIDLVLDTFVEKHGGVDKSWLPAVLTGGLKAQPIQVSNKDIEALALMEFSRDDILSTFNVPKTKVGLGEDINQANAVALDITFNKECINPRLRIIEEVIEGDGELMAVQDQQQVGRPIMTVPGGAWYEVEFANPVPEDRDALLRETLGLHGASMLRNDEGRARHGLPPFDNEFGNAVVGPMGDLIDPDEPLPEPQSEANLDPPPPDPEGDNPDDTGRAARVRAWLHDEKVREQLWRIRDGRRESWTKGMARAVQHVFSEQGQAALQWLSSARDDLDVSEVVRGIEPYFIGPQAEREVLKAVAQYIARIFKLEGTAAQALAEKANPKRAKKKPAKDAPYSWQASAKKHMALRQNKIVGVSDNRWKFIREQITKSFSNNKVDGGSATIARWIREALDGDQDRALRVARTEAGGAANAASIDGYRQGGATHKGWLATPDDRTRESHADIDGEIVPLDSTFSNGLQYPGDPSGEAEEVVNCRCTTTPEFAP